MNWIIEKRRREEMKTDIKKVEIYKKEKFWEKILCKRVEVEICL